MRSSALEPEAMQLVTMSELPMESQARREVHAFILQRHRERIWHSERLGWRQDGPMAITVVDGEFVRFMSRMVRAGA